MKASEDGFRGFACTRSIECDFQRLEDQTRHHQSGRLGPLARWQRLIAHDALFENDRKCLQITAADKYASLATMPPQSFTTEGARCSLPEELMDKRSDAKVAHG